MVRRGIRGATGQGAVEEGLALCHRLFQNLKHASDVNLKVGYDAEGQCLRSENDVAPFSGMVSKPCSCGGVGHGVLGGSGWHSWSMVLGRPQVGQAWADGPSFVLPRQPSGRMHTFRIRRRKARAHVVLNPKSD